MRRFTGSRSSKWLCIMALTACAHRETPAAGGAAFRASMVGDSMAPFAVQTLRGDTVRVAKGEPLTLLNVWATWCASCREEMDTLEALGREYGARGLRIIAVSVDKGDVKRVERFVSEHGLTLTVAHDPEGMLQELYHVPGVPSTYLIGRDRVLRWQLTGNVADAAREARRAIDAALAHSVSAGRQSSLPR